MTDIPRIARYKPYYYKLVPGETYFWCTCGQSRRQPFCDGSHRNSTFEPLKYVAKETDQEVLFCGCKQTAQGPFCDGTHNNLRSFYEEDDPESPVNREIPEVSHRQNGRLHLNGNCFVMRVSPNNLQSQENLRWCSLVNSDTGARYQSQFYFEIQSGLSDAISFVDRDVVLLMTQGSGELRIGHKTLPLSSDMGLYVRPHEQFQVDNTGEEPIRLFASVCPGIERPEFFQESTAKFDESAPSRVVEFNDELKQPMGDRSFQVLVDKSVGCEQITQFVGEIPISKAVPHRHLYEETLIVLKGRGYMWTEDMKAPVNTGDMIFLPAKQIHSLQCVDPNGMLVAGVIYPGGNPDINF